MVNFFIRQPPLCSSRGHWLCR